VAAIAPGAAVRCGGPVDKVGGGDQRPAAIDHDLLRRAGAELVVEDLERKIAAIAGCLNGREEARNVEVSLAGHIAEMSAPEEEVPVEERRVRDLHQTDAVAGNAADGIRVDLPRERVIGIEDEADCGVVGAADDLPRVAVVGDVPASGERFVADPQSALSRPLSELAEIVGRAINSAERGGRDVGADKHEIGAQRQHDVELPFSPIEGPSPLRFRHALKVAEGLENADSETSVAHHSSDLGRAGRIGEEVVLEDLDGVELLLQVA
jgi:hypothetical protein